MIPNYLKRIMQKPKICRNCSKGYFNKFKKSYWCSVSCRQKYRRKQEIKNCGFAMRDYILLTGRVVASVDNYIIRYICYIKYNREIDNMFSLETKRGGENGR